MQQLTTGCATAVCQVNFGSPVLYENCPNPGALQSFPVSYTLFSGTSIAQLSKLFSANGQYFLTPENTGNVHLYNVSSGGTTWQSSTYQVTGAPFALYMQTVMPSGVARHAM